MAGVWAMASKASNRDMVIIEIAFIDYSFRQLRRSAMFIARNRRQDSRASEERLTFRCSGGSIQKKAGSINISRLTARDHAARPGIDLLCGGDGSRAS